MGNGSRGMVRACPSTRMSTAVPRAGDERQAGQPEEREEPRGVEGTTDRGECRGTVAWSREALVEVQVEPAAVRGGEGEVELQPLAGDLEARVLERRVVDAEQALAEPS
jgi:hypothetical protein